MPQIHLNIFMVIVCLQVSVCITRAGAGLSFIGKRPDTESFNSASYFFRYWHMVKETVHALRKDSPQHEVSGAPIAESQIGFPVHPVFGALGPLSILMYQESEETCNTEVDMFCRKLWCMLYSRTRDAFTWTSRLGALCDHHLPLQTWC